MTAQGNALGPISQRNQALSGRHNHLHRETRNHAKDRASELTPTNRSIRSALHQLVTLATGSRHAPTAAHRAAVGTLIRRKQCRRPPTWTSPGRRIAPAAHFNERYGLRASKELFGWCDIGRTVSVAIQRFQLGWAALAGHEGFVHDQPGAVPRAIIFRACSP